MRSDFRFGAVLLWVLLVSVAAGATAQTTAIDRVTVSLSETGIVLLGITEVYVALEASSTGVPGLVPGARYAFTIVEGEANGGRLHYTVHGAGTLKITVRTLTAVAAGSMTVSLASSPSAGTGAGERGTAAGGTVVLSQVPQDLILGIGDCYTGTGSTDGPLVYYALLGNPGFSLGDVTLEYTLTSGI